jgi:hypothetical protein
MANFDTLEIDLEAACVGGGHPYQTACPEWDRLGHIWLCNDEGCTSESELLRWITPYSSPGRWIVDASTVLGRLREGGTTTIRIESSGNAYEFTISLRLRDTAKAVSARQVETLYPYAIAPFNATYDGAFPEVQFTPPANATKVEFYGMISGHQFGGANNCAEFCNHGHTINVNGSEFFTDFTGDLGQTGCADKVGEGVVPNQGGTWFYGRAGWCPGLEVDPWIVDITAVVTPGQPNTLDYRGSFAGATPSEGEIRFTGFVVYSW